MTNYEWLLGFLKYAGLVLATGSSLWSATNVVSKETDGRKRLTRAGKISIALTIAGLAITVSSNLLQDRINSQKAQAANLREIQKTNRIILSGQTLSSLLIDIDLGKDSVNFLKSMDQAANALDTALYEHSQGEVSSSQGKAYEEYYRLFPLMNASLYGQLTDKPRDLVFLFSLDNEQTAVLPYGVLNDSIKPANYRFSKNDEDGYFKNYRSRLPSTIKFTGDVEAEMHMGGDPTQQDPYFMQSDQSVHFKWKVPPATLASGIQKQNPATPLTANLPSVLKIAILYDIESLPVDSTNFVSCVNYNVWEEKNSDADDLPRLNHIYGHAKMDITPNGLTDQTVHYVLRSVYLKKLEDAEWVEEAGCKALLLVFVRKEEW